jgi:N-acyl-D-aspartate/D-glutamate deacylase
LPGGAKRRKQLARGIEWTVVNGQVLMKRGEHTGAYPGKVARSTSTAIGASGAIAFDLCRS